MVDLSKPSTTFQKNARDRKNIQKVVLGKHKAVILAGGLGTRLYPVTKEIPKPLLPVKRKPIINYLIELFEAHGIKETAVLVSRDFKEEFEWWKKRYFPKNRVQLIEEEKPLGTFGGLYHLKNWIGDSSFFFTNGDELKKIDLKAMDYFHKKMKAPATIALVKVPNPCDYGVVVCKRGMVADFLEKPSPAQISKKFGAGKNPPSKYINSGFYLFSPEVFDYHPGLKFCMVEKDVFPRLAKDKKLAGFKFSGKWMDCGTFERYSNALNQWK